MPEAKNLPPELEGLAFRNGLALDTGIDFHHHADRLIAGIHRVVDPPKEETRAGPASQPSEPRTVPKPSRVVPISIVVLLIGIAGIAAWYFKSRPSETISRDIVTPVPTRSTTPGPSGTAPPVAVITTSPSLSPAPNDTSPAPSLNEPIREHAFEGKVGAKPATFRLRFDQGHVTGTYAQGASTYRLEGRHLKVKMFLDEYTGERLTARIEVNLVEAGAVIRWEGTMRNTAPDNRVLPIYFERPR
jgi:hypothetical protein